MVSNHYDQHSFFRRYKLGVPVTLQMSDLPDDGETLTDFELTCNPEERRCKVSEKPGPLF